MKISAISNVNFKQTQAVDNKVENKKPEDTKKQGLSTTAKTLIGAGVVAAGTLAVYFITRNSKAAKNASEAASEAASGATTGAAKNETVKNPLDEVDEKIKTALKDFKSEIKELSEPLVEKLKTGFTRITYSGKNAEGHDIKDMVFFNKNNDVVQRMIEQVTPKENIKISYKGDKTILAKPDDIPEGRYNPKYFQRQIAVSNMEKMGNDNVPDSAFYNQTASMFDNQGRFKDITRRFKTDERKTKISTQISDGAVELKQNPESKIYEFKWDTKKELNNKNIGFAYTDDNKLNAYFTRQSKINGENNPDDKVFLKYRDKKYNIVYDTHNEMYGHEPNLYKKTAEAPQPQKQDLSGESVSASKSAKPKEFLQGFDMNSDEAKEAFNKLDPKIKDYLQKNVLSEFDDLTHRNIVVLPNGNTKVEYTGISEFGDKYKEVIIFDKNNEFQRKRSYSYEMFKDENEYTKKVSLQLPNEKPKTITVNYDAATQKKKNMVGVQDGKEYGKAVFVYDKDGKCAGAAGMLTDDSKVILRLIDKKSVQEFKDFKELEDTITKEGYNTLATLA